MDPAIRTSLNFFHMEKSPLASLSSSLPKAVEKQGKIEWNNRANASAPDIHNFIHISPLPNSPSPKFSTPFQFSMMWLTGEWGEKGGASFPQPRWAMTAWEVVLVVVVGKKWLQMRRVAVDCYVNWFPLKMAQYLDWDGFSFVLFSFC